MAQMPQPAPAPEQGGGAEAAAGKASKLVADIHSQMLQLMEIMEGSPAVSPEEKEEFASVIQGYQNFVENVLASGPGQKKKAPEAPVKGTVAPEAGAADARPY